MLVGHYGPAFALKGAERTIPLWVLFVAVQWMDVLWSVFRCARPRAVSRRPGVHGDECTLISTIVHTNEIKGWRGGPGGEFSDKLETVENVGAGRPDRRRDHAL